jgi:hypothetical protein
MKVNRFVVGLLLLMASVVMAQDMQWQSMNGPYFVYDVSGISLGCRGDNIVAFMAGSDSNSEYVYCAYTEPPISEWYNKWPLSNIKDISACRNYPMHVYAIKPSINKNNAYIYNSIDGGYDWIVLPPFQSDNSRFTCIQAHPKNVDICYVGIKTSGINPTSYVSTDGGWNWWPLDSPLGIPDDVSHIYVEPNGSNKIDSTIIYICYNKEGVWRNTNGGFGKWENINVSDNEQAVNIAVEYNTSNNLYVVTIRDGIYRLWDSSTNGKQWESVRDFGGNLISAIMASEREGAEHIWVLAVDTLFYCRRNSSGQSWIPLPAREGDTMQCISIDYKNPNQAYVGSKHNIEWISIGEKEIIRRTIAKGTNYNGPIKDEWR